MTTKNTNASWLYADKALTKKLNSLTVEKFFESYWKGARKTPLYFYDGNNGDKHMLTGWSKDWQTNEVEWVMGVNLTQCHLASRGVYDNCYKTADAVAEDMKPIENGMDLMSALNKVRTYNWS